MPREVPGGRPGAAHPPPGVSDTRELPAPAPPGSYRLLPGLVRPYGTAPGPGRFSGRRKVPDASAGPVGHRAFPAEPRIPRKTRSGRLAGAPEFPLPGAGSRLPGLPVFFRFSEGLPGAFFRAGAGRFSGVNPGPFFGKCAARGPSAVHVTARRAETGALPREPFRQASGSPGPRSSRSRGPVPAFRAVGGKRAEGLPVLPRGVRAGGGRMFRRGLRRRTGEPEHHEETVAAQAGRRHGGIQNIAHEFLERSVH